MEAIKAKNGQMVTEDMLEKWSDSLASDEWPKGEYSIGAVVSGRPPMSAEGSAVLSVKVPPAMKRAIEQEAKAEGISTSEFMRTMIAKSLVDVELKTA